MSLHVYWEIPLAGEATNRLVLKNLDLLVAALNAGYAVTPVSMADSDAANNTIYYSTTASKLVYKDSGGVVNNLY